MKKIDFMQTDFAEVCRRRAALACGGDCAGCNRNDDQAMADPPRHDIIWDSRALLQAREHVTIVHGRERYQLRQTRQGKLILTK